MSVAAGLQLNPHEPGPFGFPQVPHGPIAGAGSLVENAVATTESFFSRLVELHVGQSGVLPERTSVSNWWPHLLHAYS